MLSAHRGLLRQAVRDALRLSDRFADYTEIAAWVQGVDEDSLPAWGVATPREAAFDESKDGFRRDTDIVIVVRRIGDETIEDEFDLDAAEIERLVWPALLVPSLAGPMKLTNVELRETQVAMSAEATTRVATLILRFVATIRDTYPAGV